MPFSMTLTRLPPCPRITGRPAPGPKSLTETPSSRAKVSPMLRMLRVLNSSLVKTWTGCAKSVALSPKGWAVTTISVMGSSRPGADSEGGAPKTQGETASMKTIFKLTRNMKKHLLRELRNKGDNAKPSQALRQTTKLQIGSVGGERARVTGNQGARQELAAWAAPASAAGVAATTPQANAALPSKTD